VWLTDCLRNDRLKSDLFRELRGAMNLFGSSEQKRSKVTKTTITHNLKLFLLMLQITRPSDYSNSGKSQNRHTQESETCGASA